MSGENSAFAELLGELETLAKAMPAPGEPKGEPELDPDDPEKAKEAEGKHEEPDGDEMMGKALKVVIDGKEVDALDGTAMVKALMIKQDTSEQGMVKALGATVDLIKAQAATINAQGEMIKAMRNDLEKLATAPAGRKSALTVHEKADLTKSQTSAGPTAQDILAKAQSNFTAGKLSGAELRELDVSLRLGVAPTPELLTKALA